MLDEYLKPNPKSLKNIIENNNYNNFIIVGDTLEKEVKLANSIGIQSIWLNVCGKEKSNNPELVPTYEIHNITEILDIL